LAATATPTLGRQPGLCRAALGSMLIPTGHRFQRQRLVCCVGILLGLADFAINVVVGRSPSHAGISRRLGAEVQPLGFGPDGDKTAN